MPKVFFCCNDSKMCELIKDKNKLMDWWNWLSLGYSTNSVASSLACHKCDGSKHGEIKGKRLFVFLASRKFFRPFFALRLIHFLIEFTSTKGTFKLNWNEIKMLWNIFKTLNLTEVKISSIETADTEKLYISQLRELIIRPNKLQFLSFMFILWHQTYKKLNLYENIFYHHGLWLKAFFSLKQI